VEITKAGAADPHTGELYGTLNAAEALASGRVSVGAHTYGSFTVHVGPGDRARVRIGAYCSIAAGVELMVGGNHRADWISTYPFRVVWEMPGAWADGHPRPESDIEIGNDVWIGAQALIMPGVKIGDGAVIGARAVVTKDVRPYAIVGGVPAREIRRRFTDEQVDALIALGWWDWPQEKLRAHVDLLCSSDVAGLLALAD
jgi:acetyltransferase-like isoleucine patch superfamily enzyme